MLLNAAHDCASVAANIGNVSYVWQVMRKINEEIKRAGAKSKHCVAPRLLSFELSEG